MDSYLKHSKFRSVFNALEIAFKYGKVPEVKGTEEPIEEFKPFYFEGVSLSDLASIRESNDLKTTREELLELIESSTEDLKNFYSMFLFEPITFLEQVDKEYSDLLSAFSSEFFIKVCESVDFKDFKGENACMLTRFPIIELDTIDSFEFLKNIVKSVSVQSQGEPMTLETALRYWDIYSNVKDKFEKVFRNISKTSVHKIYPEFDTSKLNDDQVIDACCGNYVIFVNNYKDFINYDFKLDTSRIVLPNRTQGFANNEIKLIGYCLWAFKDRFNKLIRETMITITGQSVMSKNAYNNLDLYYNKHSKETKFSGGAKIKKVYRDVVKEVEKRVEVPITRKVVEKVPVEVEKVVERRVEIPVEKEVIREVRVSGGDEADPHELAIIKFKKSILRLIHRFSVFYKESWTSIKNELNSISAKLSGKEVENRLDFIYACNLLNEVKPEAKKEIERIIGAKDVDMYFLYKIAMNDAIKGLEKVPQLSNVLEILRKINDELTKVRGECQNVYNNYVSSHKVSGEQFLTMFYDNRYNFSWKPNDLKEIEISIARLLSALNVRNAPKDDVLESAVDTFTKYELREKGYDAYIQSQLSYLNMKSIENPDQATKIEEIKSYTKLVGNTVKQYMKVIDRSFGKLLSEPNHRYNIKSYDIIINIFRNYLLVQDEITDEKLKNLKGEKDIFKALKLCKKLVKSTRLIQTLIEILSEFEILSTTGEAISILVELLALSYFNVDYNGLTIKFNEDCDIVNNAQLSKATGLGIPEMTFALATDAIFSLITNGIIKIFEITHQTSGNIFGLLGGTKETGGNPIFAIVDNPEVTYCKFIEEAVPFYIIAYNIINYFYSLKNSNTEHRPIFKCSKYSPLYMAFSQIDKSLETITPENDKYQSDIKKSDRIPYTFMDFKVIISCCNKIWENALGTDSKSKFNAAINSLINELSACLIYNSKFNIEYLKFSGPTDYGLIDPDIQSYYSLINSMIEEIIPDLGNVNYYNLETGLVNYIADIQKNVSKASDKLEVLYTQLMSNKTSIGMLTKYYKFMETCIIPYQLCQRTFNKIIACFNTSFDITNTLIDNLTIENINVITKFIREHPEFKDKNIGEETLKGVNGQNVKYSDIIKNYNKVVNTRNFKLLDEYNEEPDTKYWNIHKYDTFPTNIPRIPQSMKKNSNNLMNLFILYPQIDPLTAKVSDYLREIIAEFMSNIKHCLLAISAFPGILPKYISDINKIYSEMNNKKYKELYEQFNQIDVKSLVFKPILNDFEKYTFPGDFYKLSSIHSLLFTENKDVVNGYCARIYNTDLYIYDAIYTGENTADLQIKKDSVSEFDEIDYIIYLLACCNISQIKLPWKLYNEIKSNYYLSAVIKEPILANKTIQYQERTNNHYYCITTQNIMIRSGTDINRATTSEDSQLDPNWLNRLIAIIPYAIARLTFMSKVNKNYEMTQQYQSFINILTNYYNSISQFKGFKPFMNAINTQKPVYFSIAECLNCANKSYVEIGGDFEWALKYCFSNLNIVYPEYSLENVFKYFYDFLGPEYTTDKNKAILETTLAIIGKNTIISSLLKSDNLYMIKGGNFDTFKKIVNILIDCQFDIFKRLCKIVYNLRDKTKNKLSYGDIKTLLNNGLPFIFYGSSSDLVELTNEGLKSKNNKDVYNEYLLDTILTNNIFIKQKYINYRLESYILKDDFKYTDILKFTEGNIEFLKKNGNDYLFNEKIASNVTAKIEIDNENDIKTIIGSSDYNFENITKDQFERLKDFEKLLNNNDSLTETLPKIEDNIKFNHTKDKTKILKFIKTLVIVINILSYVSLDAKDLNLENQELDQKFVIELLKFIFIKHNDGSPLYVKCIIENDNENTVKISLKKVDNNDIKDVDSNSSNIQKSVVEFDTGVFNNAQITKAAQIKTLLNDANNINSADATGINDFINRLIQKHLDLKGEIKTLQSNPKPIDSFITYDDKTDLILTISPILINFIGAFFKNNFVNIGRSISKIETSKYINDGSELYIMFKDDKSFKGHDKSVDDEFKRLLTRPGIDTIRSVLYPFDGGYPINWELSDVYFKPEIKIVNTNEYLDKILKSLHKELKLNGGDGLIAYSDTFLNPNELGIPEISYDKLYSKIYNSPGYAGYKLFKHLTNYIGIDFAKESIPALIFKLYNINLLNIGIVSEQVLIPNTLFFSLNLTKDIGKLKDLAGAINELTSNDTSLDIKKKTDALTKLIDTSIIENNEAKSEDDRKINNFGNSNYKAFEKIYKKLGEIKKDQNDIYKVQKFIYLLSRLYKHTNIIIKFAELCRNLSYYSIDLDKNVTYDTSLMTKDYL